MAVAPAESWVIAYGEEGVGEWGRVDVQEDLILAASCSSDSRD